MGASCALSRLSLVVYQIAMGGLRVFLKHWQTGGHGGFVGSLDNLPTIFRLDCNRR